MRDWIAGLAFGAFLGIPFGMVMNLLIGLAEPPRRYNPNEPLITTTDIRRSLALGAVFALVTSFPIMGMIRKDRQEAQSWQVYVRDHGCIVIDRRTKSETRFNPATKTYQTDLYTEYLWQCRAGDRYWRR